MDGLTDADADADAVDGSVVDQAATVVGVTVGLVAALTAAGLSQRRALGLAGMSRSSWHYRTRPRERVADPVPHARRRAASWLSGPERDAIVAKLGAAFEQGRSVYHGFYQALDAGDPVASMSSWYRIARQLEPQRPTRRRARHHSSAIPSLVTDAPLQVWSWDIERHEALLNRAVVKGHRLRSVAAGRVKLRAA